MARIRTIKPEFFSSEDIVSLSPLARILYVALWCEADREGRLVWKPATFKLRYLPGDSCDVLALCDEILVRGLVRLYGDGYALIPSFGAHQHINPRETSSQLPAPADDFQAPPVSGTRHPRVGTRETRDSDAQGGREGKGKEGDNDASRHAPTQTGGKKRKTPMPENFGVSEQVKTWAAGKGFGDLDQHLESFKDKCQANGYTYVNWDAAFMAAIRGDWAKLRQANPFAKQQSTQNKPWEGAR